MFDNKYPYTDFHELNLDWFLAEFKKVHDHVDDLDATVKQFTDFVTNYFNNLDVQDEINKKLDAMMEDGSLAVIIEGLFDDYKEEFDAAIDDVNSTVSQQGAKVNELESRMNTFTHLTEGSTTGDAELADIRVAANGSVFDTAGDAVRNQIARLNNMMDTNPFINVEIEQGDYLNIEDYDAPNPHSSAKRIRCEFIYPCDSIHIYSTNGMQFGYALFDADNTIIDYHVNPNYTDVLKNTAGIKTIRLQMADENDADIDPSYASSVFVQIEDLVLSLGELQRLVKSNKQEINTLNNEMYGTIPLDFIQGGYARITNYGDSGANSGSVRIRAEIQNFSYNVPISIRRTSPDYYYVYAAFDALGNLIDGNAAWQSVDHIITGNVATLRMSIRNSTSTAITPDEYASSGIYVESYSVLNKLNELSGFAKLKLMSYNIGRFSYGVDPYYLSVDYDEKLANYKKFFSEQNCDIIGLQECNEYLDGATTGSITANSAIFTYLYPFVHDIANFTCLKSKHKIYNKGTGAFTISGRQYVYGVVMVGGKPVFVMSVHLTPNAGDEQDLRRQSEANEIITICNRYEYSIVFGDFNAQSSDFFDIFTTAGYKIANGGYLPFEETYPARQLPFDNIVVSSNIIVNNTYKCNVYDDLSSDHLPLVTELTLT